MAPCSSPRELEREATQAERACRLLDDGEGHAEVDEPRDRHVAGDAAHQIEEQGLPGARTALERRAMRLSSDGIRLVDDDRHRVIVVVMMVVVVMVVRVPVSAVFVTMSVIVMIVPRDDRGRDRDRREASDSLPASFCLDQANDHHGRAEAVVDVHHADPGRAARQHAEQGGHASESSAVAHRGRDRDDRNRHEPADHARQCALHPRNHDGGTRAANDVEAGEESVQTGDADVEHADGRDAGHAQRLERLVSYGNIARAGGHHRDGRPALDRDGPLHQARGTPRGRVRKSRKCREHDARRLGTEPGDEHVLAGLFELTRDPDDLLGRLPRAENHLRGAP